MTIVNCKGKAGHWPGFKMSLVRSLQGCMGLALKNLKVIGIILET